MMTRHEGDPMACVHGPYHYAELECADPPRRMGSAWEIAGLALMAASVAFSVCVVLMLCVLVVL